MSISEILRHAAAVALTIGVAVGAMTVGAVLLLRWIADGEADSNGDPERDAAGMGHHHDDPTD